jgi:hypothetical protein
MWIVFEIHTRVLNHLRYCCDVTDPKATDNFLEQVIAAALRSQPSLFYSFSLVFRQSYVRQDRDSEGKVRNQTDRIGGGKARTGYILNLKELTMLRQKAKARTMAEPPYPAFATAFDDNYERNLRSCLSTSMFRMQWIRVNCLAPFTNGLSITKKKSACTQREDNGRVITRSLKNYQYLGRPVARSP